MKRSDKIKAWGNVFISLVIVGILVLLTKVLYPIAYVLRKPVRWYANNIWAKFILFPLWPVIMLLYLLLDDTGDYGNEEECWRNIGIYPTNWWKKFLVAYYWSAIRNPVWNCYQYRFFKGVDDSPRTDYHFSKALSYGYDDLFLKQAAPGKVNEQVEVKEISAMNRAKLYYRNPDGTKSPSSNAGDYIDLKESIFGNSRFYFKQNGKWWPLITYCAITTKTKLNEYKIREWNIGAASRILIRNKWQKGKVE